jgi:hypothetical protein
VGRAWRWLITCVAGVAAFAVVWWLGERVVGLDAGAAQALGGAALTVVTLPLAAWAAGWSPSSRSEPRLARARVGGRRAAPGRCRDRAGVAAR